MIRWYHPYSCVIVITPRPPMYHRPGIGPSPMRRIRRSYLTRIQHDRSPNFVKRTNVPYVIRHSHRKVPMVAKPVGKLTCPSVLLNISPAQYQGPGDRIPHWRWRLQSSQMLPAARRVRTGIAAPTSSRSGGKVRAHCRVAAAATTRLKEWAVRDDEWLVCSSTSRRRKTALAKEESRQNV